MAGLAGDISTTLTSCVNISSKRSHVLFLSILFSFSDHLSLGLDLVPERLILLQVGFYLV
jgi:hypothetical protein